MRTFKASLLAVLAVASIARADDASGRLAAFDALGKTGKVVKLRAKLEGKGLLGFSSVEGEFVDFWLTGEPQPGGKPGITVLEKEKFLGSGKTDSDGIGTLDWTPEAPGAYEVEARVRKGSKYVAIPATLDVLAASSDRPLTLVTIEQTLTDLSAVSFMRKDAKDVTAQEGAPDALSKLAEKHGIVYVTGIEEVSLLKTKDWLKLRGFPRGPVFFWNISTQPFSGEKYKTQLVSKLKTDYASLTSAIGGRTEDATASLKANVTTYYVGVQDTDVPPEAIRVKAWDKLVAAIDRQHEVEGLLAQIAGNEVPKQEAAVKTLAKLETNALGYVQRFLRSPDVSLAAAARLVQGRVRARDAFAASLDTSTDSALLGSLIAAWRSGDESIMVRLYREGSSGLQKAGPALEKWRNIEVVNRTEPEPGKVVYRLRFVAIEGANVERDFTFLRGDDGFWRVDIGDL